VEGRGGWLQSRPIIFSVLFFLYILMMDGAIGFAIRVFLFVLLFTESHFTSGSQKKKSRYPLVQAFHVPRGISIERQTNFGEVAFKVTE